MKDVQLVSMATLHKELQKIVRHVHVLWPLLQTSEYYRDNASELSILSLLSFTKTDQFFT